MEAREVLGGVLLVGGIGLVIGYGAYLVETKLLKPSPAPSPPAGTAGLPRATWQGRVSVPPVVVKPIALGTRLLPPAPRKPILALGELLTTLAPPPTVDEPGAMWWNNADAPRRRNREEGI